MSRRDAIKPAATLAAAPLLVRTTLAAQRGPVGNDAGTLIVAQRLITSGTAPR